MELTVLGCSGSYGAPAGGACSGYLVRAGDAGASGSTAATASFANLQQHVEPGRPHRGRHHARAPRPLRRPLRAARAVQYGLERSGPAGVRARRRREAARRSRRRLDRHVRLAHRRRRRRGRDRRRRRCASRAPTTRRPRSRSRSRTTASGSSTRPTPAPVERRRVRRRAPTSCSSEATYQHDDIRAPIHLSARQAGEAARAARGRGT